MKQQCRRFRDLERFLLPVKAIHAAHDLVCKTVADGARQVFVFGNGGFNFVVVLMPVSRNLCITFSLKSGKGEKEEEEEEANVSKGHAGMMTDE
jgi:hypothetical protein